MKSHPQHHGHGSNVIAAVRAELLDSRGSRDAVRVESVDDRTAAQNAMAALSPEIAPAELPPDFYLIGCGNRGAQANGEPWANSMGFKAWNLLRMVQLALPVPAAFVIGTSYCSNPIARASASTCQLWMPGLRALEREAGQILGDARHPLLVSVRSGAAVSMPGMMETLLNVGLCDATVAGLVRHTGHPRLVWDAYRRLVATYGEVVAGLPAELFENATVALYGARDERDLDFAELRALTQQLLSVYASGAGRAFPQDPAEQLSGAIGAVFALWQSDKAQAYRRMNVIADTGGTAVTVQCMVFGNTGGESGAGVGFTRDPATGEPVLWVDFLFNAQGEDVVPGRRSANGHEELAAVLPQVWRELSTAGQQIERAFGDMQDFEFTVQDARLFMLQARSGKRTARAAARIALDMLDEGLISVAVALERTDGLDRQALARSHVVAPDGVALTPLGRAATASNGVAVGEVALDEARARSRHEAGVGAILVRRDAETSDIAALDSALGLLTQRGARTSHAAVVARQLGKTCLVGCAELSIDGAARTVKVGEMTPERGRRHYARRQRRCLLCRRPPGRDRLPGRITRPPGNAQTPR